MSNQAAAAAADGGGPSGRAAAPGSARPELESLARRTVDFLADLTEAKVLAPDKVKVPAMPKSALLKTSGLALVHKSKRGLILGVEKEDGFVIARVTDLEGGVRWSAPVFVKGRSFCLGFTIGYIKTGMCLALMNEKAVDVAVSRHGDFGVDANFLVDMNGAALRKTQFDSSDAGASQVITDAQGAMRAKYYSVDAFMVDVSLRGGSVQQHAELNREVYGEDFDAAEVLKGAVPPPAEFQPVYDLLSAYTLEAGARTSGKPDRSVPRRTLRMTSTSDTGSVTDVGSPGSSFLSHTGV